jgi:hypothetical protein
MRAEPVIAAGRIATKTRWFLPEVFGSPPSTDFSFFDGGLPFESRSAQAGPAERDVYPSQIKILNARRRQRVVPISAKLLQFPAEALRTVSFS